MSGSVSVEGSGARARPLSGVGGAGAGGAGGGALWSLLSWLRRDDRSSSSDSLSSAGSDRTAVSFAFLSPPPPPLQHLDRADPPLSGPPTDSYRKRVHDGNLRRERERDLTLHRKYGLYYGYDAFSLPPARKHLSVIENEQDRERRANSESFPRRSAHVPGKRRAPLPPPPSRPHSLVSTASLTRRHIRKRPAPQPPAKTIEKSKENIEKSAFEKIDITVQMRSNSPRDRRPLSNVTSNECSSDKNSKKDTDVKETKLQKEKSFLRQIFENKKRNSTIEAPERILPSISELDKQAAEIIRSCKLTPIEQNNNSSDASDTKEAWFCTRCLRRYDSTVVTCQYCLPEQKRLSTLNNAKENPSSSKDTNSTQTENNIATNRISGIGADDKQKLKEMLKEMKDSLPKKSKQAHNDKVVSESVFTKKAHNDKAENKTVFTFDSTARNASLETPTLRVESKGKKEEKTFTSEPQPSTSKPVSEETNKNITEIKSIQKLLPQIKSVPVTETVVITQHVVLVAPQQKENPKLDVTKSPRSNETTPRINPTVENKDVKNEAAKLVAKVERTNLHTPLKISSLLNPVYIPKNNASEDQSPRSAFFSQNKTITGNINSTAPKPAQDASTASIAGTSASKSNQATTISEITKPKIPTVQTKAVIEKENNKTDLEPLKKVATEENSKSKQATQAHPSTSASSNGNASSDKTKVIHNMTKFTVDQHSRRRELINQLEQSIAKGDERAAAEAAVKLAQLRLSCSVLSFSSQIMGQTSGVTQEPRPIENRIEAAQVQAAETKAPIKINAAVQSSAATPSNDLNKNRPEARKDTPVVQPEKKSSEAQTSRATPVISKHVQQKLPQDDVKPITAPSTSKQASSDNGSNLTTIQVWVEDREATRGPVRLRIPRQAVMGDLRRQAETSLGLVGALQRWIVGRALCTDDRTPLVSLAGPDLSAPFYLCVVETGDTATASTNKNGIVANKPDQTKADKTSDVYSELVQLEQRALVVNTEPFECGICMEECAAGDGAVLRECVHSFCRDCLSDLVKHCEEPIVGCPAMACPGVLQEREIRTLVTPDEYERWLARGLAAAESGTRNAFHCRTRDCTGWALCDPGVRRFPCPVCKHNNCIPCQAIHEGETCEQYRKKLQEAATSSSNPSQTDEGTRALLDTLITKGEALECPECKAIITKKWGCDWVKCSACKTEICWVTRGRRWGPGGKGDTTGGCRCGVDGKRCHPSCGYCH